MIQSIPLQIQEMAEKDIIKNVDCLGKTIIASSGVEFSLKLKNNFTSSVSIT